MIQGLTNRPPQFPCIGTLRKGAVQQDKKNAQGKDIKVVGRDLTYFRFDTDDARAADMFKTAYGDEPRAITVYLPYSMTDQNFQAWRESWTASKLNHRCDGEVCYEYNGRGELVPTRTPCPDKNKPADDRNRCKQVGRLQVIVPVLERFAYVTVLTSSIYDIVALSEQLSAIEALRGSLQGIPMVLSRNEREISMPKSDGSRARVKKWMLAIEVAPEWASLQLQSMQRQALQLPAPTVKALPNGTVVDMVSGEIIEDDDPEWSADPEPAPSAAEPPRQPRAASDLATCKSCGAGIAWAKTANGKNCPYDVDADGVRTDVSHFSTCPNAKQHSTKPAPPAMDKARKTLLQRAEAMQRNPKLPVVMHVAAEGLLAMTDEELRALIAEMAEALNKPGQLSPVATDDDTDDIPF